MSKRLTKLPLSIAARSLPTCCMLSPIEAALSRSMTNSALLLVDLDVGDRRKSELAAGHPSSASCCANATNCSWSAVEAMTNSTGKVPALGSGEGRNAGARIPATPMSLCASSSWMVKDASLALAPRLHQHAAEAAIGERDLEGLIELGLGRIDMLDLFGERSELLERRVGRHVDRAEHHALIFFRRELDGREHVHRDDEQGEHDPHRIDAGRASSVRPRRRSYRRLTLEGAVDGAEPAVPACSGRRSFEDIIGESVNATMPEMKTAPAKVNANSRKSAPVKPP